MFGMGTVCPVCNGMESLHIDCPQGGHGTADMGRFNDYLGPYSPYRPIDEISSTNGFMDVAEQQCIHVVYCELCNDSFYVGVNQWNAGQI